MLCGHCMHPNTHKCAGVQHSFEFGEHRATLAAIVGTGYGSTERGKQLLRLHAADIVSTIKAKCGDDVLRQIEVALAVKQRLTGALQGGLGT